VFSEILSQVVTQLERARKNGALQAYALIGGFAVSAWSVSRATQDIYLAVALGTTHPQALASHLNAIYEAGMPMIRYMACFISQLGVRGRKCPCNSSC